MKLDTKINVFLYAVALALLVLAIKFWLDGRQFDRSGSLNRPARAGDLVQAGARRQFHGRTTEDAGQGLARANFPKAARSGAGAGEQFQYLGCSDRRINPPCAPGMMSPARAAAGFVEPPEGWA